MVDMTLSGSFGPLVASRGWVPFTNANKRSRSVEVDFILARPLSNQHHLSHLPKSVRLHPAQIDARRIVLRIPGQHMPSGCEAVVKQHRNPPAGKVCESDRYGAGVREVEANSG